MFNVYEERWVDSRKRHSKNSSRIWSWTEVEGTKMWWVKEKFNCWNSTVVTVKSKWQKKVTDPKVVESDFWLKMIFGLLDFMNKMYKIKKTNLLERGRNDWLNLKHLVSESQKQRLGSPRAVSRSPEPRRREPAIPPALQTLCVNTLERPLG